MPLSTARIARHYRKALEGNSLELSLALQGLLLEALSPSERRVLNFVKEAGDRGVIAEEIARKLYYNQAYASVMLSLLKKMGLLRAEKVPAKKGMRLRYFYNLLS